MIVRLMVLSALEVLAFAGALAAFLHRITSTLERIGGNADSYLAKVRFGVSAIEKMTSHLAPQVTQLNQNLVHLAGQLSSVDEQLTPVAEKLAGTKETAS